MINPDLWARIEAHDFSDPRFADRLSEAEGWDAAFTAEAILEYKRFLYLTQVSAMPCTPSHTVDKVWHEHLTHTHDYWERLVPHVLGRALHHDIGTGSRVDLERHRAQFAHTLTLYRQEFGHAAPSAAWGTAPPGRIRAWVMRHFFFVAIAGFVVLTYLPVIGFRELSDGIQGGLWLGYLCAVFWGVKLLNARRRRRKPNGDCGGVCVEYEISFSLGGDGENGDCGGGGD